MFDRPKNSMLGPLPGVNQSRNYLRPFLCHRISFCPFSSSHLILAKKICINRFLCLLALTARWGVALQSEKSDLRFTLQCPQQLINIKEYDTMSNQDFVWQELPPAEARIGVVPRPGNSMDRNLIISYYAEKYCDKRFLDGVINLIPDSGLKTLWSLIPFFWALTLFLWALISVIFLALSPEPIYHVTTLSLLRDIYSDRPKNIIIIKFSLCHS